MGGAIFMPLVLITYSIARTFIPDSKIIKKVSDLPITKFLYFLFVYNFLLLGIIGGKPVEYPYYEVSQLSTAFFFFYFLIFPVFTACELVWVSHTEKLKKKNNVFKFSTKIIRSFSTHPVSNDSIKDFGILPSFKRVLIIILLAFLSSVFLLDSNHLFNSSLLFLINDSSIKITYFELYLFLICLVFLIIKLFYFLILKVYILLDYC